MFPVCTIDPIDPIDSIDSIDPIYRNSSSLKNNYFSGNFYLLQEPGFPDQENRAGGAYFLIAFNDYKEADA